MVEEIRVWEKRPRPEGLREKMPQSEKGQRERRLRMRQLEGDLMMETTSEGGQGFEQI